MNYTTESTKRQLASEKEYTNSKAAPSTPLAEVSMTHRAHTVLESTIGLNNKLSRLGALLFGMFETKDPELQVDGNINGTLTASAIMLCELHRKVDALLNATTDN